MKSATQAMVEQVIYPADVTQEDMTLIERINGLRERREEEVPHDAIERIEEGMQVLSDEEICDLYRICKSRGWVE